MSSNKSVLLAENATLKAQNAALIAERDALAAAASAAGEKPKRIKKEKKARDPDAPKRPLSPYLVFCAAKRAEAPDSKLKAADLGEMWKLLSDDQKAAYKSADAPASKPKPAKKERDPSKPKEPSAYLRFCAERRAAHTGDTKLTLKELGAAWKALDAGAQAGYKSS